MKTVKPLLAVLLLLALGAAAAVLVVFARAARHAPEEPLPAFDGAAMERAIDAAWRAGEKELTLRWDPATASPSQLRSRAELYLALLGRESPRYRYTVDEVDYAASAVDGAAELRLHFRYQMRETPYDELPRASSPAAAFALFEDALRHGETVFDFLTESAWTADELNALATELLLNASELAAETNRYRYEVMDGSLEPCSFVRIEAEYPVDPELLDERTREMRETLDALAAEIEARGGDERARYLAAARAVAERAAFDEALGAIDDAEALSEAQRVDRSAYGALVSRHTVCTGYAMAFKALCDRLGLPCRVVGGERGGAHAWNLIRLDGLPLFSDCTYADVLGDESYLFMDGETLAARGYALSNAALVFPEDYDIIG